MFHLTLPFDFITQDYTLSMLNNSEYSVYLEIISAFLLLILFSRIIYSLVNKAFVYFLEEEVDNYIVKIIQVLITGFIALTISSFVYMYMVKVILTVLSGNPDVKMIKEVLNKVYSFKDNLIDFAPFFLNNLVIILTSFFIFEMGKLSQDRYQESLDNKKIKENRAENIENKDEDNK